MMLTPAAAAATAGAAPLASISSTVLDGSLWLSIPLAALAGLVSFASPCVLPLVPGYLGYVAGLAGSQPQAPEGSATAALFQGKKLAAAHNPAPQKTAENTKNLPEATSGVAVAAAPTDPKTPGSQPGKGRLHTQQTRRHTRRMLAGVALFVLGFSAVFVTLSVLLAQVGAAPWLKGQAWVNILLGALVILMGVVFMGRLSILQVDKRFHTRTGTGLWGAPVLGVTFGLGWAPCIGPTFAAVQTLVFTGGAATFKAVVLTFAYCLGLGVPFLLVAYFAARGVNTTGWASTHKRGIQRAGGAMLILIGILILTGAWNHLMAWVQAALPVYELPI